MTNLFDLTGRTAIVTGSAQGMGRAMADWSQAAKLDPSVLPGDKPAGPKPAAP